MKEDIWEDWEGGIRELRKKGRNKGGREWIEESLSLLPPNKFLRLSKTIDYLYTKQPLSLCIPVNFLLNKEIRIAALQ